MSSSLENRICQKFGHNQLELDLICIKKTCDQPSLCCLKCIQDSHRDHNLANDFMEMKNFQPLQENLRNQSNKVRDILKRELSAFESRYKRVMELYSGVFHKRKDFLNKWINNCLQRMDNILSERSICNRLKANIDVEFLKGVDKLQSSQLQLYKKLEASIRTGLAVDLDIKVQKLKLHSQFDNNCEYHIYLGKLYRKKGLYDSAIQVYQAALNIDGQSQKAHYGLAKCYLQLNNKEQFDYTIRKITSRNHQIFYQMRWFERQGQQKQAKIEGNDVNLKEDKKMYNKILLYLFRLYRNDGDIGICEKILKKGMDADKSCIDYYLEYSGLLFSILKLSDDAVKYCNKALEHSPNNERVLETKAKYLVAAGKHEEGQKFCIQQSKRNKSNAVFYRILVQSQTETKKFSEAISQCELAMKETKFADEFLLMKARIYFTHTRSYNDCKKCLADLLKRNSNDLDILNLQAKLALELKDREQARIVYAQMQLLDAENRLTKEIAGLIGPNIIKVLQ